MNELNYHEEISEYLVVCFPSLPSRSPKPPPGRGTLAVACRILKDRLGPIGQFPTAFTVLILPPIALMQVSNLSN